MFAMSSSAGKQTRAKLWAAIRSFASSMGIFRVVRLFFRCVFSKDSVFLFWHAATCSNNSTLLLPLPVDLTALVLLENLLKLQLLRGRA
jgi:hypothetical protein